VRRGAPREYYRRMLEALFQLARRRGSGYARARWGELWARWWAWRDRQWFPGYGGWPGKVGPEPPEGE
jgi:hypothetical protein